MLLCIPTKLSLGEGSPSVEQKISDKKVNQILGYSYIAIWDLLRCGLPLLHYQLIILRCGLPFYTISWWFQGVGSLTLSVDAFKVWAPLLHYQLMILRCGLP